MPLFEIGSFIRDTYEVESLLGEGAFAEVYRVKHEFLGRQALKAFRNPELSLSGVRQLLDEAILLSRFAHPNLVKVFDANIASTPAGKVAYFTMEYVAGGTLFDFWRSFGEKFVPIQMAVDILRQVCRGLAVAHGQKPPLVHRDIKPQNILIGYDGSGLRARVSDFGLAKSVDPVTLLVAARGTRRFKPPEVFRDPEADSCSGDVWAVGCLAYLLLTDRLPYGDLTDAELEQGRAAITPLAPPSSLNHRVDRSLDAVVARSLASKPGQRYATAKHMLQDLEAWTPPDQTRSAATPGDLSDFRKEALGQHSGEDPARAKKMADSAVRLSRTPGRLADAADLMEEALKKSPLLRERYEFLIQLWRRGLTM